METKKRVKANSENLKTLPYELFDEQGDYASHGVFASIEEAHGAAEYDKLSKYSIWQENGDKVFDNSEKDFTRARLSKMSKVELIFQTITWIEKGRMEIQQLENLRELLKREKEEIETRMKIPGLKIK